MHHWCFDSPVGLALALLQMRARRTAVSTLSSVDDAGRYAVAQDIARVTCFLEFIRPVLEGLALFAEHDLTVGQSEIISRPALLTGFMFAGRQSDPAMYLELAPAIIQSARLAPAHIRRKANLLVQPFCGTSDGYLAGYLYIRLLYRIALERCEAYLDADFFVHALRCWLFDDWDLVDLLLEGATDYEQWCKQAVLYCQKRINEFLEVTADDLARFEKRGVSADADLFEYRGPHLHMRFYSHPVLQGGTKAKSKLKSLLDGLFREEPSIDVLRKMFATDLELLGLRTTLTLGHGGFDARVSSGRMLQIWTDDFPYPLFVTGAPDDLPAGWRENVQVDLILGTAPPGLYQFITNWDRIIASQSFRSDQKIHEYLQTSMVNWEKRHEKMNIEDNAVAQILTGSSEEFVMELTFAAVQNTRSAVFELKVLSLTPDELIEHAQEMLSKDGFLPVLDGSLQLVLDAAAISVCAALCVRPQEALPNWQWSLGNARATVDHINECFVSAFRYSPFLVKNGDVIFSMI
jgi:hypothetical protein